ncbi:MAG: nucleoid-associated protein, partial [Prevotellaceae bacterium]|nr:nucleoid-associated protein [Prevotellaceae bacterium]
SLCRDFVKDELPQQVDISKADQIDLLNRSIGFFKEKDSFNLDEFTNEVMQQPDIIQSFTEYKSEYQKEFELDIADNFTISDSAVKKQARIYKSVIKLDKNFQIYIHGNRDLLEQGSDKKGKFYKIYYQNEN